MKLSRNTSVSFEAHWCAVAHSLGNPGLDDFIVFHQSFVTKEPVNVHCLCRNLLKLCCSFRISLYSARCCMIYWLCEPLFCHKKSTHLLTRRFFGDNSRNTGGTSKVKHCKKGFREIFQMNPTKLYVCFWNFWENRLLLFFARFGQVCDHFQEKSFTPTFVAFSKRFLNSTACKDYN